MNKENHPRVYHVIAMEERRPVPETRRGTTTFLSQQASALETTIRDLETDEHFSLLAKRIEDFTARTHVDLDELREAINARNTDEICEIARRLTDLTGRMGAIKMMRLCIALQMLGRRDMLAKAEDLAADLEKEFQELKRTLLRAG